jgi:hypothetical protein
MICSTDIPVNRRAYERNYLRIWGWKCPKCSGPDGVSGFACHLCLGVGYIPKPKKTRRTK